MQKSDVRILICSAVAARLYAKKIKMNNRQQQVSNLCEKAIISLESSKNQTFSEVMTKSLINEIKQMKQALDPQVFSPSYGRAVIDCYTGKLANELIELEYDYSRIRKKNRLREDQNN